MWERNTSCYRIHASVVPVFSKMFQKSGLLVPKEISYHLV